MVKVSRKLAAALLALVVVVAIPAAVHGQAAVVCNNSAKISQTATAVLVTGVAGKTIYICGLVINSLDATPLVALVEGTGTTCGTGTVGLIGDTTNRLKMTSGTDVQVVAATAWLSTKTTGDDLCLNQSGVGTITGVVSYNQK